MRAGGRATSPRPTGRIPPWSLETSSLGAFVREGRLQGTFPRRSPLSRLLRAEGMGNATNLQLRARMGRRPWRGGKGNDRRKRGKDPASRNRNVIVTRLLVRRDTCRDLLAGGNQTVEETEEEDEREETADGTRTRDRPVAP